MTTASPTYRTHFITTNAVNVYFTGADPLAVPASSPMYDDIIQKLSTGDHANLYTVVNLAAKIKAHTKGRFHVVEQEDGTETIFLFNQPMPNALSTLVLDFVEAKQPTEAIEAFWRNCCKNPSEQSRNSLYDFITANNMTLTDDGCFIGYRSIRSNWTDHNTGSMDNSIGSTVKMNREDVDPDPLNTCSRGLHVAAWGYASSFCSYNNRMIEVKVNPKDVVTVPPDYNNEKMRVCEFKVLREVSGERSTLLHPDTFVDQEVEDAGEVEVSGEEAIAATETFTLPVCTNGGVNIPSVLAKKLGVSEGDKVFACYDADTDEVLVRTTCCGMGDSCANRTVDKHNSIRLGKGVFSEWPMTDDESVEAVYDASEKEIVITFDY